jgi:biopolymer transport protein ExbD
MEAAAPKKARIEIIPLIDVIFFLLATFVLFTLALNKTGGLPGIQNPKAVNYESRDPKGLTISIPDGEGVGWDRELLSLGDFVARLDDYKRRVNPAETLILISGDVNAGCNSARYVFDQLKKAGFQKVMIEVTPDAGGGPPRP